MGFLFVALAAVAAAVAAAVLGTETESQSSPDEKGEEGEMAVYHALSAFTEERGFYRYHNLILPDGKGGTTEIDSVMFSRFGIFVFEVKNYNGWIFGNGKNPRWTQMLNKHSKVQFQNPLRQNYKHLAVLRRITRVPDSCFCNIVVFVGDAEFKTPMPDNVVYLRDVADSVSATAEAVRLSDAQVSDAIAAVMDSQSNQPDAAAKHRDYVRGMRG